LRLVAPKFTRALTQESTPPAAPLRFAHTALPLFTSRSPLFAICVDLAHARFARRYAHFESTIPNSPPIQPHEFNHVDISLSNDDESVSEQWSRVSNSIASPVAYFQKIGSDSSAFGKAVATVDASHTRVFSYLWNQHSYGHMNRNADKEGTNTLNKFVFPPNSHSMLRVNIVNFGMGVSARVFSTWFVWRQEPDKSFTLAFAPLFSNKRFDSTRRFERAAGEINGALESDAAAGEAIRGTVKGFWCITPLAPEGKRAAERAGVCLRTDWHITIGLK